MATSGWSLSRRQPPPDIAEEVHMGKNGRAALLSVAAASLAAVMVDWMLSEMSSKPKIQVR